MQTDTAVDAPADALAYAKNLYRTRMPQRASSILESVIAVLRADLAPNRAAFGERSARDGQARQLVCDSGSTAVDLRIKATGDQFDIRGQVLGLGFENGEVEVLGPDKTVRTSINDASQFVIAGLRGGEYSLTLKSGDKEIFIEHLVLD